MNKSHLLRMGRLAYQGHDQELWLHTNAIQDSVLLARGLEYVEMMEHLVVKHQHVKVKYSNTHIITIGTTTIISHYFIYLLIVIYLLIYLFVHFQRLTVAYWITLKMVVFHLSGLVLVQLLAIHVTMDSHLQDRDKGHVNKVGSGPELSQHAKVN